MPGTNNEDLRYNNVKLELNKIDIFLGKTINTVDPK